MMSLTFSGSVRCENLHDDRLPCVPQVCGVRGGGGHAPGHRVGHPQDYTEVDDGQMQEFGLFEWKNGRRHGGRLR